MFILYFVAVWQIRYEWNPKLPKWLYTPDSYWSILSPDSEADKVVLFDIIHDKLKASARQLAVDDEILLLVIMTGDDEEVKQYVFSGGCRRTAASFSPLAPKGFKMHEWSSSSVFPAA